MTTICAATDGKIHAIAADGRSTWGERIRDESFQKLLSWGPGLPVVALAGETRTTNLIETMLAEDPPPSARDFAERLRSAMIDADYAARSDSEGGSKSYGFSALYLSTEGVWLIGCDFSVSAIRPGFPLGAGSGGDYATGAMYESMSRETRSVVNLVLAGVAAGKALDSGSGGGTMLAVRGATSTDPQWVA